MDVHLPGTTVPGSGGTESVSGTLEGDAVVYCERFEAGVGDLTFENRPMRGQWADSSSP